jgi:hypothetical protein
VITALNEQVKILQGQVEEHFGRHPDAEIILSQPGPGMILGARVLAEFGEDPHRYRDGKSRRNYADTSPVARASGERKVVTVRFVHNDRLVDALNALACSALSATPGARACTTSSAPAGSATTTPSGACPTGLSALSTDASKHAPSTTKTPTVAIGTGKPLDKLSGKVQIT